MTTQQTAQPAAIPDAVATPSADAFLRYEARFTEVVPIGPVPAGLRIDAHYAGTVVEGQLAGAAVRGIDYVLVRADGVHVLDVRAVITTAAGEPIEVRAQGYGHGRAAGPPPSPAVLRSPAFRWPDAPSTILGVSFCQTAAPELAWLNRTVFVYTGTGNLGTGTLEVSIRALTPEMVLGPPMEQDERGRRRRGEFHEPLNLAALKVEVAAEIDAAVVFAEAGPWEPVEELTRFVSTETDDVKHHSVEG